METLPSVVRVAVEYGAGPLWDGAWTGTGPLALDLKDVPLSDALREQLQTWTEAYWTTLDPDYPPDSHFPAPEAENAWVAEGWLLARQVAVELAGRADVVYFDLASGQYARVLPGGCAPQLSC
jgi:hypothetical protein